MTVRSYIYKVIKDINSVIIIIALLLLYFLNILNPLYVFYSLIVLMLFANVWAIRQVGMNIINILSVIVLGILFLGGTVVALPLYVLIPLLLSEGALLVLASTLSGDVYASILSLVLLSTTLILAFIIYSGHTTVIKSASFSTFIPPITIPIGY